RAQPESSVVRVIAQLRPPNPIRPWARQAPVEIGGTGVVIDSGKILTNAHLVTYATELEIQGAQGGDRVSARIEAVGQGVHLAILPPEEPSFLDGHPPITRARTLPKVGVPAQFYGFPVGGSGLAIGRGTIARIEYSPFDEGSAGLLIQVDAAVNPGNS